MPSISGCSFNNLFINKLLKEQPDIDGIALPGMPIGTPGMPGDKDEPYVIYQLKDGKSSVLMTI